MKRNILVSHSKPLFTVAQAARAWGMSDHTLRRRIQSGFIEAVKERGALQIEATTVQAFLAARWCPKEPDTKEVRSR